MSQQALDNLVRIGQLKAEDSPSYRAMSDQTVARLPIASPTIPAKRRAAVPGVPAA